MSKKQNQTAKYKYTVLLSTNYTITKMYNSNDLKKSVEKCQSFDTVEHLDNYAVEKSWVIIKNKKVKPNIGMALEDIFESGKYEAVACHELY